MNAAKKFRPRSPPLQDDCPPPKRTRVSPPEPSGAAEGEGPRRSLHTHSELWKWTLTASAVAPCRVQDIFALQECSGAKSRAADPDFFWLGRVPCRSVLVVGVVVGVQQYELRTVYNLDDGTGVIECNLRHNLVQPPRSPQKRVSQAMAKYYPPRAPAAGSSRGPPEPPKPVASVGDIVRVVGRVLNRHSTRIVNAETIVLCKNPTEEPLHWLAVAELHKSWYHPPNPELFVIPQSKPQSPKATPAVSEASSAPSSPAKASVASSAPSTPSSAATSIIPLSPPRLRHPSRLHSRDLTANTFRIYVKHYMDNAPRETPQRRQPSSTPQARSTDDDDEEDEFERLRAWLASGPETPTKAPRKAYASPGLSVPTPKPSRPQPDPEQTPRPRSAAPQDTLQGYTLSHLRRVPELALLARRVVDAEAKRRARDERKKEQEQSQTRAGKHAASPAKSYHTSAASVHASLASAKPGEPRAAKVKRLFRFAVRQLYDEGSIVLWDGAVCALPLAPLPAPAFRSSAAGGSQKENRLWRVKDSQASSASQEALDDGGELSDPPEDEDAYVPLTSEYLCEIVERAIKEILEKPVSRREGGYKMMGQPPGPTPEEITSHLHRRDERWARVGSWAVKDALNWGKERGRVWCIGDDRWELCG